MDFKMNLVKKRMERIQLQADEAKEQRRKDEERRLREEEEREKAKQKKVTKAGAGMAIFHEFAKFRGFFPIVRKCEFIIG